MKKYFGFLCAFLLIFFVAVASQASSVSYDITEDLSSSGFGPSSPIPYGTVTLTEDGSDVDFLVHLNNGNEFFRTGAGDRAYFLFNASGITLNDFINPTPSNLEIENGDGSNTFGNGASGYFQYGVGVDISGNGGGTAPYADDIEFTITNSLITDFLGTTGEGYIFAVDMWSSLTGNTGLAAAQTGNTPSPVPEPATMFLLGSGLVGLSGLRRKFKK